VTFIDKVARAKRGDDEAFADLVMERKDRLYRIAYSYVGSRDDALDNFDQSRSYSYQKKAPSGARRGRNAYRN